jgi:UDP-glucose:glycoprotein glucosyltransferase
MDVMQAWVVMQEEAIHDLDNIRLKDLEASAKIAGVKAGFALKHILVEGHARDVRSVQMPPRGLQFILGTPSQPAFVDTIVMANLGYFQLKANPGVWSLRIREGRSQDFYEMEGAWNGQVDLEADADGVVSVIVNQFRGALLYTRVSKELESNVDIVPGK